MKLFQWQKRVNFIVTNLNMMCIEVQKPNISSNITKNPKLNPIIKRSISDHSNVQDPNLLETELWLVGLNEKDDHEEDGLEGRVSRRRRSSWHPLRDPLKLGRRWPMPGRTFEQCEEPMADAWPKHGDTMGGWQFDKEVVSGSRITSRPRVTLKKNRDFNPLLIYIYHTNKLSLTIYLYVFFFF